jgi:hypothetical protein
VVTERTDLVWQALVLRRVGAAAGQATTKTTTAILTTVLILAVRRASCSEQKAISNAAVIVTKNSCNDVRVTWGFVMLLEIVYGTDSLNHRANFNGYP